MCYLTTICEFTAVEIHSSHLIIELDNNGDMRVERHLGGFYVYSVIFFLHFLGAPTLDTGFPTPSCLPYNTCFTIFLHDLYLLTRVLASS